MTTIIVPAGQVSAPQAVAPGVVVTATPATGGTAFVEYTLGSLADIQNGVATWYAWSKGTVSAAAAAIFNKIGFIRCTAATAPAVLDANFAPNNQQLSQFALDWASLTSGSSLMVNTNNYSVTNTTLESPFFAFTVPANTFKPGDVVRFNQSVLNSGGGSLSPFIRVNNNANVVTHPAPGTSVVWNIQADLAIVAGGTANSLDSGGVIGPSATGSLRTLPFDPTAANEFEFNVQPSATTVTARHVLTTMTLIRQ